MCQGCHGWIGFQKGIGQLTEASKKLKSVKKTPANKPLLDAGDNLAAAAEGFASFYRGQTGKDWKKPYFS